jgi:hypothetical protein
VLKIHRFYSILSIVFVGCFAAGAQSAFTSSNLPIVVINTSGQTIVDDPKIVVDMGIIDNGPGVRNKVTDAFTNYNGKIGIEIRGSSSQMFPKKQYGFELQDAAGKSVDASLLGMPKKDDWILFAPYNDKSLMRDVLAYKLARAQGRYASRSRYCEVVINGQYQGIYVLLEKVKRDKNRVDIAKLDPDEISGENLTGGYIIKIDKASGSGGDGWTSSFPPVGGKRGQTTYFQYEYPKEEDIVAEQKNYIKSYMNSFETALNGSNFKDPNEGYARFIDVASFIDFFLISELSKNPDAYRISTFMYKKKEADGGKLFMGPAWDFNLGFGNVDYCTKEKPEGFVLRYNSICPDDGWLIPFWWDRLFEDDAFKTKTAARWTELRNGPYKTENVLSFIDSVSTVLNAESQQRNFQKWPVLGQYVWPNAYVGQTYKQEVDWLKAWIAQRLTWLDANIPSIITAVVPEKKETTEFSISISPNPVAEEMQLDYHLSTPGNVRFEWYDVMGRKVNSESYEHPMEGDFTSVSSVRSWGGGTYLLKAIFKDKVRVQRIVKR